MGTPQSLNNSDYEELKKASSMYQPPASDSDFVSSRVSTSEIAARYSVTGTDPIYKIKAAHLAANYLSYRSCKGDGKCGWRAIAFSYFETLLQLQDLSKMAEERVRWESLNNLLEKHIPNGGYDMLSLQFESTFEMFERLTASSTTDAAMDELLRTFNDSLEQDNIIYHVRSLANAWIRCHADDYAPFLDVSVDEYCQTRIEPIGEEIDDVSVQALHAVLVAPAGFDLEVLYFDRSPSGQADVHKRHRPDTFRQLYPDTSTPTMRLFYTIGHYDIIYTKPPPQNPQVGLSYLPDHFPAGIDALNQPHAFFDPIIDFPIDFDAYALPTPALSTKSSWSSSLGASPWPLPPTEHLALQAYQPSSSTTTAASAAVVGAAPTIYWPERPTQPQLPPTWPTSSQSHPDASHAVAIDVVEEDEFYTKDAFESHLNPINFMNRDSFQPDEAKFDRNGRYIEPKPAPNPRRARPRRGG